MTVLRSSIAALLLVLLLAPTAFAAERTLIGRGSLATIAAGPGVDLVAWTGNGRLLVARVGASGVPATLSPVDLGPAISRRPAAVWDGAAFVVASRDFEGIRIRRLSLDGAPLGAELAIASSADALALFAMGTGDAALAWARHYGPLLVTTVRSDGTAGPTGQIATNAGSLLAMAGGTIAWTQALNCPFTCPERYQGLWLDGIDRALDPAFSGGTRVHSSPMSGLSLAATANRTLLAFSREDEPGITRLRLNPLGRWTAGAVPFVMPLGAEERDGTFALTADGLQFVLDEALRPAHAWWMPLAAGERTVGTLPASGRMVVESDEEIALYTPSAKVADIAFTITHSSADATGGTLRVKVENRGPDAPEWTQIWVTGRVIRASAPLTHAELVHSTAEWSAVRLEGPLHRGTGYEVFLTFAPPFDPSTAGVWYYPDGVDPDPSNNVLFPPIAMEEEPGGRRRAVRR